MSRLNSYIKQNPQKYKKKQKTIDKNHCSVVYSAIVTKNEKNYVTPASAVCLYHQLLFSIFMRKRNYESHIFRENNPSLKKFGKKDFAIPITWYSKKLGIHVETAYRIMKSLKSNGIITVACNKYRFNSDKNFSKRYYIDFTKLEQYICLIHAKLNEVLLLTENKKRKPNLNKIVISDSTCTPSGIQANRNKTLEYYQKMLTSGNSNINIPIYLHNSTTNIYNLDNNNNNTTINNNNNNNINNNNNNNNNDNNNTIYTNNNNNNISNLLSTNKLDYLSKKIEASANISPESGYYKLDDKSDFIDDLLASGINIQKRVYSKYLDCYITQNRPVSLKQIGRVIDNTDVILYNRSRFPALQQLSNDSGLKVLYSNNMHWNIANLSFAYRQTNDLCTSKNDDTIENINNDNNIWTREYRSDALKFAGFNNWVEFDVKSSIPNILNWLRTGEWNNIDWHTYIANKAGISRSVAKLGTMRCLFTYNSSEKHIIENLKKSEKLKGTLEDNILSVKACNSLYSNKLKSLLFLYESTLYQDVLIHYLEKGVKVANVYDGFYFEGSVPDDIEQVIKDCAKNIYDNYLDKEFINNNVFSKANNYLSIGGKVK